MYYIDSFLPGFQYHGNKAEVYPGGKGLNILRVLSSFIRPLSFYAFTAGDNGKIIKKEAKRLGAQSTFIEVEGETRTTINIMDKKSGNETEIKEKGPFITEKDTSALLSSLESNVKENDIVILSGSLPDGIRKDIYKEISELSKRKGASTLLDTGGGLLKTSLPGRYLLVKPNENEIRDLFDDYSSPLSLLSEKLINKGADSVLITRGGEGAYFRNKDMALDIKVPKVDVVSTIGSGDSTLAGFAYGLSQAFPLSDTVSLALSFGTSNALHREVGRVDKAEVEDIIKKIEIRGKEYDL